MTQPTKRKHVLKVQEWFELISENSSFVSSKLNLPCLLLCKTWHSSFSPFSPPSLITKYLKDILVSKLNALSTCRMRHKHVSFGLFSKLTNENFWTVRCHWISGQTDVMWKTIGFFPEIKERVWSYVLASKRIIFKTNSRVFFYFLRFAEILTEFESKTGSESDIAVSGRSLCDAACCLHIWPKAELVKRVYLIHCVRCPSKPDAVQMRYIWTRVQKCGGGTELEHFPHH